MQWWAEVQKKSTQWGLRPKGSRSLTWIVVLLARLLAGWEASWQPGRVAKGHRRHVIYSRLRRGQIDLYVLTSWASLSENRARHESATSQRHRRVLRWFHQRPACFWLPVRMRVREVLVGLWLGRRIPNWSTEPVPGKRSFSQDNGRKAETWGGRSNRLCWTAASGRSYSPKTPAKCPPAIAAVLAGFLQ